MYYFGQLCTLPQFNDSTRGLNEDPYSDEEEVYQI